MSAFLQKHRPYNFEPYVRKKTTKRKNKKRKGVEDKEPKKQKSESKEEESEDEKHVGEEKKDPLGVRSLIGSMGKGAMKRKNPCGIDDAAEAQVQRAEPLDPFDFKKVQLDSFIIVVG